MPSDIRILHGHSLPFILLAIITLALGMNACSVPPPENKTAENGIPEICGQIDAAAIKSVLEAENFNIQNLEGLSEGAEGCKYIASGPESANTDAANFNIIRRRSEDPSQTKNAYISAVNIWQNSTLENREYSYIENLGDGAFFAYGKKTPQLVTYRKNTLLIITFGNLEDRPEKILEKARSIAEIFFAE